MTMSSNQKGAIAETAITLAALEAGIEVYRPIAEGGRFDLILALPSGDLSRVQCKWANLDHGAIVVRARSCRRATEGCATGSTPPRRSTRSPPIAPRQGVATTFRWRRSPAARSFA
jgi:hypothetical protein